MSSDPSFYIMLTGEVLPQSVIVKMYKCGKLARKASVRAINTDTWTTVGELWADSIKPWVVMFWVGLCAAIGPGILWAHALMGGRCCIDPSAGTITSVTGMMAGFFVAFWHYVLVDSYMRRR